ncbi:MAG: hypothetical protein KGI51_02020 [Rhodospirillales bacterium]|nr:hypothetical protein [Rhodospirillales bacterium]
MIPSAIPTWLIVPPLLAAFVVLAFLHWRGSKGNQILDPRFLLMAGAIVVMFAQILTAGTYPLVSLICFPLALLWLVAALLFLRRYRRES